MTFDCELNNLHFIQTIYANVVHNLTLSCQRKRLLSLVAQKFVSDIAADAFQHARLRTNATGGGRAKSDKSGQGGSSNAVKVSVRKDENCGR